MKNFLMLILCVFAIQSICISQNILNGDILINCGSNTVTSPCSTFTGSCILNWGRSHGTPPLDGTDGIINLLSNNNKNQGTFVGYPFCPDQTYLISVTFTGGVVSYNSDHSVASQSLLKVSAADGLTTPFTPAACLESDPSALSVLIGTAGASLAFPYPGTTAYDVTVSFTFSPSAPFSQLWLIHNNPTNVPGAYPIGNFPAIWIENVKVEKISCTDLTLSTTPAPDTYQGYGHIFAGSSYGMGATAVDASSDVFDAGEAVFLSPNFISGPVTGNYFLAEVTTCNKSNCQLSIKTGDRHSGDKVANSKKDGQLGHSTIALGDGSLHAVGISSASKQTDGNSVPDKTGAVLDVYPNPTQNNITVTYPCRLAGQLEISIKDVAGRMMYSESVTCTEGINVQQQIDMSTFASGVYFVDLTLGDQHTVKKVVKL